MAQDVNLSELCPDKQGLKREMKPRHLLMISIGGTIGTGLFLGSGQTINQAGPLGAILAYMVGGLLMYLVLLCLGELATAMPVAGSFQTYATRFISPAAGFTTGWLYWINWAICIAADFTAAGIIATGWCTALHAEYAWFPIIPVYVWCALFAIGLAALNLMSVKAYGEAEFWFAGIKVVAIVSFILAGTALMFGWLGKEGAIGMSNFQAVGGLFPNGPFAMFVTMIAVVYSFQGAELVGIAAAECREPGKTVPKVINGVAVRIVLFYILAMFVLAGTIPWKEAGVLESPFAHVFGRIGINSAVFAMSFVVLTSALSAGNSALYACSRLLWSMAKEKQAPSWLGVLNSRGVPMWGIMLTLVLACMSLLTQAYAANTVYLWLMSSTGLTGCLIWMIIAWCQFNFRREFVQRGGDLQQLVYRTPLFPLVPIVAFLLNLAVIVSLWFDPSNKIVLYTGIPIVAAIYLYYKLFMGKKPA